MNNSDVEKNGSSELDFLKNIIKGLEQIYSTLEYSEWIGRPFKDKICREFRHQVKGDFLFIYLKGVRWISLLNASVVLLEVGHVHEMGILCRCMDESYEDMLFFTRGFGEKGEASEDQRLVLEEFFQEEFEDLNSTILQRKKRSRLPRKKIRAAVANTPENIINSSDHIKLTGMIYGAFSGYVHGAYPHIMELYGGNPPKYHMKGMLETPRMEAWECQFSKYVYRAILGTMFIAKRLGENVIIDDVCLLQKAMENYYPYFKDEPELIKKMKKKKERK